MFGRPLGAAPWGLNQRVLWWLPVSVGPQFHLHDRQQTARRYARNNPVVAEPSSGGRSSSTCRSCKDGKAPACQACQHIDRSTTTRCGSGGSTISAAQPPHRHVSCYRPGAISRLAPGPSPVCRWAVTDQLKQMRTCSSWSCTVGAARCATHTAGGCWPIRWGWPRGTTVAAASPLYFG